MRVRAVTQSDIDEVTALLSVVPEGRAGDYVSYFNEDDPSEGVALRRADGTLVALMSTETYEAFRKKFSKQAEAQR